MMVARSSLIGNRPMSSKAYVPMKDPATRLTPRYVIILMMIAALPTIQAMLFGWEPIDDAYISYRFAAHWATGEGCVFNEGQRVEGYSNFLWVALLAGAARLGLSIPNTSIVLGAALSAASIWLTWFVTRDISGETSRSRATPWIACLLLAVFPGWAYWAFSGMEGMLLTCLILAFFLFGLRPVSTKPQLVLVAMFGLAAALTRWEAVLTWPIVLTCMALERPSCLGKRVMRAALVGVLMLAGFLTYFVVRLKYCNSSATCNGLLRSLVKIGKLAPFALRWYVIAHAARDGE